MTKKDNPRLAPETLVEVVKIEKSTGISQRKKTLTYKEALKLKSKGFYYRIYQIGYSS